MTNIEFEQIHKSLWNNVTIERKNSIIENFKKKYLRNFTRILMPNQTHGMGVFVYKKPETNKILWIEVFSLDAPTRTARIWTGWKEPTYKYLCNERYSIHLCFIFSDSNMFCIIPPNLVSSWFRNDPNSNQRRWYIEIAPRNDGLNVLVTGEHRIIEILLSGYFMNIEIIGLNYSEEEPPREDLYRLLLRSCLEGIN